MQKEFIQQVIEKLERLGVTYAITGSIASNYWGTPRFTHDLDVLVVLDPRQAELLATAFPQPFYASAEAARDAVRSRSMFNVIDVDSGLKVDFWVSKDDEFSRTNLARRQRVEIAEQLTASVSSPEDVLLHKLVWYRITPSDRQLADAAGIAAVQAGKLDLAYLREWAARQGTSDLLEEVLQGKYLKWT